MTTCIENIVKYFTDRDLTGVEIEKLVGKSPILYSNLKNYTFNSFFPKGNGDYQILILQTKQVNIGHYVLCYLSLDGKSIEYFDSYGLGAPDTYKNFTPYDEELPNYLSELLQSDSKRRPINSNYTDYQKWGKSAVCGRWCAVRCILRMLDASEFESMFIGNKSKFLERPDWVVCMLTLLSLNDIRQFFNNHSDPKIQLRRNISGGESYSRNILNTRRKT